jgi:hypothetical protein
MFFVLAFIFLTLALPVIGEVWRHRSDNIVKRSGQEAASILEKATLNAKQQTEELALRFLWLRLLSALLSIIGRLVQNFVRFLE